MIAKTRKKDETRRSILASAQSLFKQKGYEATSVDEIVQAADLVKGTFYYHFDSKEQVLLNLTLQHVVRWLDDGDRASRLKLLQLWQ